MTPEAIKAAKQIFENFCDGDFSDKEIIDIIAEGLESYRQASQAISDEDKKQSAESVATPQTVFHKDGNYWRRKIANELWRKKEEFLKNIIAVDPVYKRGLDVMYDFLSKALEEMPIKAGATPQVTDEEIKKPIVRFTLHRCDENVFIADTSFAYIRGEVNTIMLDELLKDSLTSQVELREMGKDMPEHSHKEITLELEVDSGDDASWYDFKVLSEQDVRDRLAVPPSQAISDEGSACLILDKDDEPIEVWITDGKINADKSEEAVIKHCTKHGWSWQRIPYFLRDRLVNS